MRTIKPQMLLVKNPCPICGYECSEQEKGNSKLIECSICGRFSINTFGRRPEFTEHHKWILKNYFINLPDSDERRLKIITNENIDEIVESVDYPKNLIDKVDNILAYFVEQTQTFEQIIELKDLEKIKRKLFCINDGELNNIINYLSSAKYIRNMTSTLNDSVRLTVTMDGLQYYRNKIIPKLKTKQCFVAMWFNTEVDTNNYKFNMQDIYSTCIKPAIEHENKFTSIKIDNVEHCNDINDEMVAQIRKSCFMVADLTGYRGGVYWEAGFAYGLGLPVIYTCHEQWLEGVPEKKIEKVHFDLNHRNIIKWNENNLPKFKEDLIKRINAVII